MRLCFRIPCRSCLTSGRRAWSCPQSSPDNWLRLPESTTGGLGSIVRVQCVNLRAPLASSYSTLEIAPNTVNCPGSRAQIQCGFLAALLSRLTLKVAQGTYLSDPSWAEASKTTQNCLVGRHATPFCVCVEAKSFSIQSYVPLDLSRNGGSFF